MQKISSIDLGQPKRQSKAAILIFMVKTVYQWIRKGWAALVPMYLGLRNVNLTDLQIGIAVGVIVVIWVGFSYLSYLRFLYYLKDDEVIIEKGVLFRSKLSLPFDKVQTINFKQNILQQIFQVVQVEIDSAGSGQEEVKIDVVDLSLAKEIRSFIYEKKEEKVVTPEIIELQTHEVENSAEVKTKTSRDFQIMHLSPFDLFKIGITQNHIRSALIFLAFAWNIYDRLKEVMGFEDEESLKEVTGYFGSDWTSKLTILFIFVMVLSLVVSVFVAIIRNFDFRLLNTGNGIKKIAGLFEKHEQSTTFRKIQSIWWGDNLLKKIFRLNTLRLFPTSQGRNSQQKQRHISVPGCYPQQINDVVALIYGKPEGISFTSHKMDKAYIYRSFLFIGVLPVVLVASLMVWKQQWLTLWLLLWLPLVYMMLRVYHRKWTLKLSEGFIHLQYGMFAHQHKMLAMNKIQLISFKQSPYQRRKKLATLHLVTAGKNFTFSYLNAALATQLQNYILYKVESSKESWM